ncbi:MAG: MFS transporter [Erysipelotrichaceae bacterium]|nr:MFS transporter [Erysipelotrichaceae bacterium]MDP3304726.1 MFS transporter [Erysipelotrichaceae bacterium]
MNEKRVFMINFALYLVAFISLALAFTQLIPFLIYVGYDPLQRGIILSTIAFVSFFGQLWSGYLCDRYRTVKRFFGIFWILLTISSVLMYYVTAQIYFFHIIAVSFVGGLFRVTNGLLETWTIETSKKVRDNFGMIRAFGAIGWAIGAPLTSFLVTSFGYQYLGLFMAVAALITYGIASTLPDATKMKTDASLRFSDIRQLLSHKPYMLLMVIFVLVSFVMAADMYTVIDKILVVGGTNDDVGLKWSFQAIMELPFFFLGGWMLLKLGSKKILIFSIIFYIIRFVLYAIVQTPFLLIAVSGMQMLTFPLYMIAQKVLIDDETPAHLKSSGQMLGMALFGGLPTFITPLLAGVLVNSFGYDTTLMMFAISLVIPLILSFVYQPKNKAV